MGGNSSGLDSTSYIVLLDSNRAIGPGPFTVAIERQRERGREDERAGWLAGKGRQRRLREMASMNIGSAGRNGAG